MQPSGTVCRIHAAESPGPQADLDRGGAGPGPRGRADAATGTRRREAARRRGRRRAAARIEAGHYRPSPRLEHSLPVIGRLRDQATALRVVELLVKAQCWRSDRRAAWSTILRHLVHCMDWARGTGLVTAVTARRLGDAGSRSPRTVSRVIAWAVEVGLIVVAEKGASATFLGSSTGRTPTYAFYLPTELELPPVAGLAHPAQPAPCHDPATSAEELGDLPTGQRLVKPLTRCRPARVASTPWPLFGVPRCAADRGRATLRLLERLGLVGSSGVVLWRAKAMLAGWWNAGACPAGLLHAVDHHPDQPDRHRGDAFRGARNPLRVLAHRLEPWAGRLAELPAPVRGVPGDYLIARGHADSRSAVEPRASWTQSSSPSLRATLRARFAETRNTSPG
ncbi:hypothetical protein [Pseudonocardia spinosispora]|uniref:hypothetical protein n=1 Tax=Pseudonocardia spinosispora TaxID=103441 RepID=UPI0012EBF9E2|nr:hypothetical protein [Pseudonocardia spinosispora]